jgi:serine/threonine-protein kinase
VDTYAVGAILYELLTGRPPFRAGTAAETVEQVIASDPVPPSRLSSKVPRDLEIICLKCLHKEPRLRYLHTADLKKDLDRFLSGEAISARPERWLDRRARQARRRPVLSTLLAIGILLVSFAIFAIAWIYAERAAMDQQFATERTASLHSASDLLDSMVEAMNRRAWPEARVSLNRAEAALGKHHETETQRRMDQGHRDLEMVDRLNAIRLNAVSSVGGVLSFAKADTEYEEAFLSGSFGGMNEKSDIVAVRVRA